MKIYLLERKDNPGWDENVGFVIRAKSSQQARKIAAAQSGDEPSEIWLSPDTSRCTSMDSLQTLHTEEVLLASFNAG